ncbi:MAG TPA: SDR family NAD(P)-dependent oxidoreductase, partial [Limnochordia bacterium]|nr:SDR family NAD(P)-dependent oxidoreductase [Limnochordia bacterium]
MQTELAGRNVLVTGATGGIGEAISRAFAEEGAHVGLHYHQAAAKAEALCAELAERYPHQRFAALQADVADQSQVEALFAEFDQRFGELHVMVANAGINRDMLFAKADWEEWHHVVEVNLLGVVYCCHAAAARMPSGGRIVNISSVIGHIGSYGLTNYAAAKSGLIGFTKSLAAELGRREITVNCVAPGYIDTPMTAPMT